MKKTLILISMGAAFLLVLATFPSVVASQNIKYEKINNEDESKILETAKEENTKTKWFPGFILVQLLKGVFALILTLLILLDLAEPENATG